MSHSTWCLSLWWQDFLTKLKPYFSLNESSLLLLELSIRTLATSPNRYAAGIPGSTANSSYLVKGIRVALSFSQECGMVELLTKSDRLDIQSLCSGVMPPTSVVLLSTSISIRTSWHRRHLINYLTHNPLYLMNSDVRNKQGRGDDTRTFMDHVRSNALRNRRTPL